MAAATTTAMLLMLILKVGRPRPVRIIPYLDYDKSLF